MLVGGNPDQYSSTAIITVNSAQTPTVSVSATATSICAGTSVTFTATPTNGGATPSYQWKVGTTNVGTNSPTYTSSALTNGQVVTVVMTSSVTSCQTSSTATSSPITMTVNVANTMTLASASGSTAQTLCLGSAITTISYNTTGATGATFNNLPAGLTPTWTGTSTLGTVTISGTPTVSGVFNYTVTQTGGCSPLIATGTITVNPKAGASVIVQTTASSICAGSTVTFTALPTNAGVSPSYQWKVGNTNVGTNSPTYTTSTLTNGQVVTVSMTTAATTCRTASTVTSSNSVTMTVSASNTVSLKSAAGTNAQTPCINTAITNITYSTTGATGATVTGLPSGVTGSWSSNVVTISGTPTASGTFNYTVTLTGGCGTVTASGSITVKASNTVTLSSAVGTNAQTICISTAISKITYATTGATGATVTGLPSGVTGSWSSNVLTISGTPTQSGTFNYSVTLTGGCGTITTTGSIIVTAANTVSLTSATGTNAQTPCINTAITNITYNTTGATNATVTGLPAGVTGSWSSNVVTISGTPTVSGTYNYTVSLTGGCGAVSTNGSITVKAANAVSLTSAVGTNAQTKCINTAITNITYSTTSATGATVTGLPSGVTGTWSSNVVTISGTPTQSGTFNYTVTLTGGCGSLVTAIGSITVTAANTVSLTSAAGTNAQTPCINSAITSITYSTTGATGASVTGLPSGVTGSWSSNVVTISGTPTVSGTFNYTVTLTGGCGTVASTGSITVKAANAVSLTSASGTNAQTKCINTAITNITYSTTGATGATVTGLPTGVTGTWASNVVTISGTPTQSGTFPYTVTLTGGCGGVTVIATGSVTVTTNTVTLSSASGTNAQTICINSAITNITYTTTGGTGIGTATGLPAGVTAAWSANKITISGTPTASGTFNYSIPLTGGCGTVNATGTITVSPVSKGGSIAGGVTVCGTTNSGTLTLSGQTGAVVRWESSPNGSSWSTILNTAGLTSFSYLNVTATTQYRAVVQSGTCAIAYSSTATVTYQNTPVGGTIAGSATYCQVGTYAGTLTLSGYTTGVALQWQTSPDNTTWTVDNSSTTNTYSYKNVNKTTYYRVKVGSCANTNIYSSTASIVIGCTVAAAPVAPSTLTNNTNPNSLLPKASDAFLDAVVMPNPSSYSFNMKVASSSPEKAEIMIYDVVGRPVEKMIAAPGSTISFGNKWAGGVYVVEIRQGKLIKLLKVVKL